MEVNGSSNGKLEADNFEEAVNQPFEDQSHEEEQPTIVEEKIEDLMAAEPVFEIGVGDVVVDEEDTAKNLPVEINGLENGGVVGNGEAKMKGSFVVGETKPLMDGNEVDGGCDVVLEKSRNGDLDNTNLAETPVIHEKGENGDDNKVEAGEIGFSQENESNGQILHQDVERGELEDSLTHLD
ncbi:hypothetical protein HHK36_001535 [Tetracentron sinense]|uniref:Uncharacterized protein n=1 Tax=Tetracentron sinense TaxID=13715 RepID=A0A834YZZ0_TETSI|nr:hypothetical protein HHK36_032999 [Tetracentron sinense]KAF8395513.1 hypothetical protein HHK36_019461 [Tetracentron sinense]KAF8413544.1 hypothetical protein HHK36_001535 [Tetracentron sinense]